MFHKPKAVYPNSGIRVVAPCGTFARPSFARGIELLRQRGFQVEYDEVIFSQQRYLAGSDELRLADLKAALQQETTQGVWVVRGGFGSTRLLPGLELEWIRAHPKWLIGFSDVTALHARWNQCGVMSLHGANITTLADASPAHVESLLRYLAHQSPTPLNGTLTQEHGSVCGPLLGSNLSVLMALIGTPYVPDFSGAIVLLEDVSEAPYRLDRMLTQLQQTGVFKQAKGFAIGQFYKCISSDPDLDNSNMAMDVVMEHLCSYRKPILAGLPIGHGPDAMPVVLGQQTVLDLAGKTLTQME